MAAGRRDQRGAGRVHREGRAGPGGRGQVAGQVRGRARPRSKSPGVPSPRNAADGDRAGQARPGDADRSVGSSRPVQGNVRRGQRAGIEVRVGVGHRVGDGPAGRIGCRGAADRNRGSGVVHDEGRAGPGGRGQVARQVRGRARGDRNPQAAVAADMLLMVTVRVRPEPETADGSVGRPGLVQRNVRRGQGAGIEVGVGISHRVSDGPTVRVGCRGGANRNRGRGVVHGYQSRWVRRPEPGCRPGPRRCRQRSKSPGVPSPDMLLMVTVRVRPDAGDGDRAFGGSRLVQRDVRTRPRCWIEVRVGVGHRVGDRPAGRIGRRGGTDGDGGRGIVHDEGRAGPGGRGRGCRPDPRPCPRRSKFPGFRCPKCCRW